jgi:hypothetical protein
LEEELKMGSDNPKGEDSLEHIGIDERVTQCIGNVLTTYFWFKTEISGRFL